MQVVIMAGGEGNRLRPLTANKPKPMASVANQPLLEHILRLVHRHGYGKATLTVHYRAEAIQRYFGSGERLRMSLDLAMEPKPLGTAGGVRAAWRPGERALVLSGDALTDLDLTEMLAFHKAHRAMATMALHEVLDPTGLGVVQIGPDGRVQHFVEKPARGMAAGRLVNTGIYILEPEVWQMIPPSAPYDFGRNLFPLLVERGARVYGWHGRGYWCDAGTLERYLDGNLAALHREVRLEISGREVRPGIWIGGDTHVHPEARLEAPVLVGDCAWIGAGAHLHGCVVGAGAVVEFSAGVEHSVVLAGQVVEPEQQVHRAIVSEHGLLQPEAGLQGDAASAAAGAPA